MANLGQRAASGLSYRAIEKKMDRARRILAPRTPEAGPFPCAQVFDELDRMQIVFSDGSRVGVEGAVKDAFADGDIEGYSYYDAQDDRFVVTLGSQRYEALVNGNARARYTFAHEVAHIVLHPIMLVRRALMSPEKLSALAREPSGHKKFEDLEWQANAGAAALLMPAAGIAALRDFKGAELEASDLSQAFGVSLQAAEIRLRVMYEKGAELVRASID